MGLSSYSENHLSHIYTLLYCFFFLFNISKEYNTHSSLIHYSHEKLYIIPFANFQSLKTRTPSRIALLFTNYNTYILKYEKKKKNRKKRSRVSKHRSKFPLLRMSTHICIRFIFSSCRDTRDALQQ